MAQPTVALEIRESHHPQSHHPMSISPQNQPTFNIGNLNASNSAVNLGGTIQGDQIGNQTNYTFPNPQTAQAQQAIANLWQDIRRCHPQASDTEIVTIIDNGLTNLRQTSPPKWQAWIDLFSVVFAGGVETVKLVLPLSAPPIEIVRQLYAIWERNRKQLPNG